MLKKIKRAFGFGSCDPMEGSTIIINAEKLERRVALLENGVLEEYTIEREGEDNIVGGIFKGRVKNIEPGLKAMFVDIGQEKNAFLHFWDALPAALDSSLEEIEREGRPKKQQRKITSKDIPDIYPIGSENHGAGHQGTDRHQGSPCHNERIPGWTLPGPDALYGPVRHLP